MTTSKAPPNFGTFNGRAIDLTVYSSDGMALRLESKTLSRTTGAFPVADDLSITEPIQLEEDGALLELLFQFTTPKPHPSLEDLDFTTLMALAESAAKYQVYSAIEECESLLIRAIDLGYAEQVFWFGIRHDYALLISSAAPFAIHYTVAQMTTKLPSHFLIPWALFREAYQEYMEEAILHLRKHIDNRLCVTCADALNVQLVMLGSCKTPTKNLDYSEVLRADPSHLTCLLPSNTASLALMDYLRQNPPPEMKRFLKASADVTT